MIFWRLSRLICGAKRLCKEYIGEIALLLCALLGVWMMWLCMPQSANAEGTMYAAISSGVLNIRDKPGKHGAVIGHYYPGDSAKVISVDGGWALCKAPIEAGEGYVSADYLTDKPDDINGEYTVKANGRVRVRNAPDGKHTGGYVRPGDRVTVTVWQSGWANIGKGWVDGKYLDVCELGG